jgi:hypothetical protein
MSEVGRIVNKSHVGNYDTGMGTPTFITYKVHFNIKMALNIKTNVSFSM